MKKRIKFVPYKSRRNGKWYWKLVAANGEKIATGHEPFARKPSKKVLDMLIRNITGAIYVD